MSRLFLPFTFLLLPPIVAADDRPEPAIDLRTEVIQSLHRSAVDDFAGTLTFSKERWPPVSGSEGQSLRQFWTITTDGKGGIRAELVWPNGDSPEPMLAVESSQRQWMSTSRELIVVDKAEVLSVAPQDEGRLFIMQTMTNSAKHQLDGLVGAKVAPSSVVEVLMLDRDPTNIRAVVEIDGQVNIVSFVRLDGALLIDEITRDDGRTTLRRRFSDYRRMGDGWIAGSVEHSQRGPRGTKSQTYSHISLSTASDPADLGRKFLVPEPGESDFGNAYVVKGTLGRNCPGSVGARGVGAWQSLERAQSY
ncbi:MAG: hypothetical protein O7B26_13745 [Planctomycetota bacterium]|nr:hypothetical protein [Planctomycetota bacterium]